MHQVRTAHARNAFRWVAFWWCCKLLGLGVALALIVAAVVRVDCELLWLGFGVLLFSLVCGLLRVFQCRSARCPLCAVPVMAWMGCSKHRQARRLFGSYRLRVALSILFLGHFRCQFCNEPTTLKAKNPH